RIIRGEAGRAADAGSHPEGGRVGEAVVFGPAPPPLWAVAGGPQMGRACHVWHHLLVEQRPDRWPQTPGEAPCRPSGWAVDTTGCVPAQDTRHRAVPDMEPGRTGATLRAARFAGLP